MHEFRSKQVGVLLGERRNVFLGGGRRRLGALGVGLAAGGRRIARAALAERRGGFLTDFLRLLPLVLLRRLSLRPLLPTALMQVSRSRAPRRLRTFARRALPAEAPFARVPLLRSRTATPTTTLRRSGFAVVSGDRCALTVAGSLGSGFTRTSLCFEATAAQLGEKLARGDSHADRSPAAHEEFALIVERKLDDGTRIGACAKRGRRQNPARLWR